MKSDMKLKQDIEDELLWDPKVNAAQIGVSVDKGAVSLLGAVDTYAEKWAAEDATKRVNGVRTVAQELTVKLLTDHVRTDSEIAAAVQSARVGRGRSEAGYRQGRGRCGHPRRAGPLEFSV